MPGELVSWRRREFHCVFKAAFLCCHNWPVVLATTGHGTPCYITYSCRLSSPLLLPPANHADHCRLACAPPPFDPLAHAQQNSNWEASCVPCGTSRRRSLLEHDGRGLLGVGATVWNASLGPCNNEDNYLQVIGATRPAALLTRPVVPAKAGLASC